MTKEDFIKAGFSEEQIEQIEKVMATPKNADGKIDPTKISRKLSELPTSPLLEDENRVTSIYDLQRYSKGQIVRLPDFAEGQPFIARMRRPSLLIMAKNGKIPNRLLSTATTLFNGGGDKNANTDSLLSDTFDVCEAIAEAALVEPTLSDIKNSGIELSDNQLIAIFNYAQRGVEALDNFRKK